MTGFPRSPKTIRGGIVLIDPSSGRVRRTIALQYNPDTLTRTLQAQGAGAQSGDRLEALRLKGPPVETIRLEAELDATDQLADRGAPLGIHPQLAALETIVYPASQKAQSNYNLSRLGTLEIAPVEAPLSLFVWSATRVLPVRLTEFSVTEDAFDPALNPIRARVTLAMQVLSVNDLPFTHRGSGVFIAHHREKERLAAAAPSADLGALGIRGIP